jgi:hypothetical protein
MKKPKPKASGEPSRVSFRLPKALVAEVQRYAELFHGGDKNRFVADAIRAYIDHVRIRHTEKLRESYALSAKDSLGIAREWDPLAEEAWARLDELEAKATKAK